jgi:hypothetical protein
MAVSRLRIREIVSTTARLVIRKRRVRRAIAGWGAGTQGTGATTLRGD